jgi:cytochrome P450
MRENHPVVFHEELNAWGVFTFEYVRAIFRDDVNWSSAKRFEKLPDDQKNLHILANTVAGIDPPEHRRVRNLAQPSLGPKAARELRPRIAEISAALLDKALPRGTFDLIAEYAHPLPQMVINEILGIPIEDFELSKQLSDRMEAATGRYTGAPFTDVTELRRVNDEYRAYFAPIFEARRHEDKGDVMSMLVRAEQEGDRLSNEELFKMAMIINRGGSETTMTGIAQMIRAMMEFPDQYERVKADPALIPSAVEEALRYYPPSHSMSRVAVRDVEIGGQIIPQGATVLMWLPAANRDPAEFPDPDRFDVGRAPNPHLSLGFGIHKCIGLHLARMEMQVVLEQWIERVRSWHRAEDGPIDWSEVSLVAVFPRSYPVTVEAA